MNVYPTKNGWRVLLSIFSTCSLGAALCDFSNYHATISVIISYELANLIAMRPVEKSHTKLIKLNDIVVQSDTFILIILFLLAIFGYNFEHFLNLIFGNVLFRICLFLVCVLDFPVVWATRGATLTNDDIGTMNQILNKENERRKKTQKGKKISQGQQVAYNKGERQRR